MVLKFYNDLALLKKISLLVLFVLYALLFIKRGFRLDEFLLFILILLPLLTVNKKSWKRILIFVSIGLLIGIIPFLTDVVCGFVSSYGGLDYSFEKNCTKIIFSPWMPVGWIASNIFDLSGDKLFGTIAISIISYPLIGIIIGIILNKRNDKKNRNNKIKK